MLNENDLFETSDLPLVAALLSHGAKIEFLERNGGPRVSFYFRRERALDKLVEAFWAHSLTVEPLQYFNALKEAKTRLYGVPIIYGN